MTKLARLFEFKGETDNIVKFSCLLTFFSRVNLCCIRPTRRPIIYVCHRVYLYLKKIHIVFKITGLLLMCVFM